MVLPLFMELTLMVLVLSLLQFCERVPFVPEAISEAGDPLARECLAFARGCGPSWVLR